MRVALELRYRLLPMIYSLAHVAHTSGAPLVGPLMLEFPHDPSVLPITDQFLLGGTLLAAPVMIEGAILRQVWLPTLEVGAGWFAFNSTTCHQPGNLTVPVVLTSIPIFVRAGAIVPVAPPGVQSTAALSASGPLEVQVYAGRDCGFELAEDDGVTTDYLAGRVRITSLSWNETASVLSWTCRGRFRGAAFGQLKVTVFRASASPLYSAVLPIGEGGSVHF